MQVDTACVAKRLADLYRRREFEVARTELFARDAVSHAPAVARVGPGLARKPARRPALPQWSSLIEQLHCIDVDEPLVAGNCFALTMSLDSTVRGSGRWTLDDLCGYYHVAGDKIVSERFFYTEYP
jgi:hypothetical protein